MGHPCPHLGQRLRPGCCTQDALTPDAGRPTPALPRPGDRPRSRPQPGRSSRNQSQAGRWPRTSATTADGHAPGATTAVEHAAARNRRQQSFRTRQQTATRNRSRQLSRSGPPDRCYPAAERQLFTGPPDHGRTSAGNHRRERSATGNPSAEPSERRSTTAAERSEGAKGVRVAEPPLAASEALPHKRRRRPGPRFPRTRVAYRLRGRYWDRTSDLFRVREARYRCANRPNNTTQHTLT